MDPLQCVEIPKVPKVRNWKKATWSKQVRELQVGESLQVDPDYSRRLSQYIGAKNAFPGAKFSVRRQDDGTYIMTRIS